MSTPCACAAAIRENTIAARCTTKDTVKSATVRAEAIGAGRDKLNIFLWTDAERAREEAAKSELCLAAAGLKATFDPLADHATRDKFGCYPAR